MRYTCSAVHCTSEAALLERSSEMKACLASRAWSMRGAFEGGGLSDVENVRGKDSKEMEEGARGPQRWTQMHVKRVRARANMAQR